MSNCEGRKLLSGAAAMDFADTLSSAERARVHAAAEQVGLYTSRIASAHAATSVC